MSPALTLWHLLQCLGFGVLDADEAPRIASVPFLRGQRYYAPVPTVDWGNVPTWVGAITSGGALSAAASSIVLEGRRRHVDRISHDIEVRVQPYISGALINLDGSLREVDKNFNGRVIMWIVNRGNRTITVQNLLVAFTLDEVEWKFYNSRSFALGGKRARAWDLTEAGEWRVEWGCLDADGKPFSGLYMRHRDAAGGWHQGHRVRLARHRWFSRWTKARSVPALQTFFKRDGVDLLETESWTCLLD